MISVRLYLDKRGVKKGEPCPVKLMLNHHTDTALINLGVFVLPSQFDAKAQQVVGLSNRDAINAYLMERRTTVFNHLLRLTSSGELQGLTLTEVRQKIKAFLSPDIDRSKLLVSWFKSYISKCRAKRTRELYSTTLKKIEAFDPRASELRFESISKDWLVRFDRWLAMNGCPSVNGRSVHLRNLRAVFNDAIDNSITSAYPFRRFKIKSEVTAKRAVSVEALRSLFVYPVEPWQQKYVDCFMLSFMLIGMNLVDLLSVPPLPHGGNDRLVYRRSKTGRLYDIKVEPEALALIKKNAGRERLVSWGEHRKSYRSFLMQMDRALKKIGTKNVDGSFTPAFPTLTSYVARHTWATLAAKLDVPADVISHALGHGMGNRTTAIYIDFDMRKVDAANRRVLDWVLYGKR